MEIIERWRTLTEDSFGRQKVSEPYTIFDSHNRYQPSLKFFSNITNGATITYSIVESSMFLNVTTAKNSIAVRESTIVSNYQPGKSLSCLMTFVMAPAQSNLYQRVGYNSTLDGIFVEVSDQVYIVKRNNGTDTRVPQSLWNGNNLLGLLDMTKAQIFWMDIEWLGVGQVRCGFIIEGRFYLCHTFKHSNQVTAVYMTTASLPMRYEIGTTGTLTAPATLKQICSSVVSDGGYHVKTDRYSQMSNLVSLTTADILYPIVSIRLKSKNLDAVVLINEIELLITTVDHGIWKIVKNATLSGSNWVDHSESTLVEVDTAATSMTGGRVVNQGLAYQQQIVSVDMTDYNMQLSRTTVADVYTLAIQLDGANMRIRGRIGWNEV